MEESVLDRESGKRIRGKRSSMLSAGCLTLLLLLLSLPVPICTFQSSRILIIHNSTTSSPLLSLVITDYWLIPWGCHSFICWCVIRFLGMASLLFVSQLASIHWVFSLIPVQIELEWVVYNEYKKEEEEGGGEIVGGRRRNDERNEWMSEEREERRDRERDRGNGLTLSHTLSIVRREREGYICQPFHDSILSTVTQLSSVVDSLFKCVSITVLLPSSSSLPFLRSLLFSLLHCFSSFFPSICPIFRLSFSRLHNCLMISCRCHVNSSLLTPIFLLFLLMAKREGLERKEGRRDESAGFFPSQRLKETNRVLWIERNV